MWNWLQRHMSLKPLLVTSGVSILALLALISLNFQFFGNPSPIIANLSTDTLAVPDVSYAPAPVPPKKPGNYRIIYPDKLVRTKPLPMERIKRPEHGDQHMPPKAADANNDLDGFDQLVEEGQRRLRQFEILHNNPDTLPLDKASKIVLVIASKDRLAAMARVEEGYGPTKSGMADLGVTVRAELAAADADVVIQPIGPAIRSVSKGSNTTWEWYVTPKTTADFEMTLRLFNQMPVDGQLVETEGPAYTNVFHVRATLGQKAKYWISLINGWLALLGGSIIALSGWGIARLKARFWPDQKGGAKKAKKLG